MVNQLTGPADLVTRTPPMFGAPNHELDRWAAGDSEPARADAVSQAGPSHLEDTGLTIDQLACLRTW